MQIAGIQMGLQYIHNLSCTSSVLWLWCPICIDHIPKFVVEIFASWLICFRTRRTEIAVTDNREKVDFRCGRKWGKARKYLGKAEKSE